jgi:hypothetical protein
MGLAAVLTLHNLYKPLPAAAPRWMEADRQLCDAINAPAAVARQYIIQLIWGLLPNYASVEIFLETVVYFALVGLLWYLVRVEVHDGFRDRPLWNHRTLVDLFGLVFGGAVVGAGFGVPYLSPPTIFAFLGSRTYSTLVALTWCLWGLVIVLFYATDLRAAWKFSSRVHSA